MTPELQHRVNEANEKDRHLTLQGRQDVETINALADEIQRLEANISEVSKAFTFEREERARHEVENKRLLTAIKKASAQLASSATPFDEGCTLLLEALPAAKDCDHDYPEPDTSKGYPGEWYYGPCKKCGQPRP